VRKEENLDQAIDRVYDYIEAKLMQKMENTRKEVEQFYVNNK